MTYSSKVFRIGFAGVMFISVILASGLILEAQDRLEPTGTRPKTQGRDPFRRYEPPRMVVKKSNLVAPPSIEERISQYRAQKQAAMLARIPAPKPTTALLLREVQVVGITRTPRGYAAIVEAMPIKMSFVIYPGEKFYDGQLVAIEDDRLVFRRETVYSDGRRERTAETKPLRQPSSVDSFSLAKGPVSAVPEKHSERPTTAEKP